MALMSKRLFEIRMSKDISSERGFNFSEGHFRRERHSPQTDSSMLAALESCSFEKALNSSRIGSFNSSQNDLCRCRLQAIPEVDSSQACASATA